MTLVSLDTIVQADATLIVGVIFLVTLKQALNHQKVTRRDLRAVAFVILLYALSASVLIFPDLVSNLDILLWGVTSSLVSLVGICTFVSMLLFYLGMAATAGTRSTISFPASARLELNSIRGRACPRSQLGSSFFLV